MSGNTSDEFNSTPPLAFKTLLPDVTQEMLNSSSSTDKEDAKEIINSDNQLWANEETNTNLGIYHNTCCDPLGVNEFESSCDSLVSGKVNEVKEKNMFYLALDDDPSDFDSSLDTNKAGSSSYYSANLEDKVDGFMPAIMSRPRSESIASLEYYRTQDATLQVTAREELHAPVEENPDRVNRHTQQSRRIPYWLWYIIAKSLGIKLHEGDRPIVATVLYTFTFMSALGFFLSTWWFTGYDIVSDYTKTTVIDGTADIFFTLLWGALGVYANKLAYKLFSHKKFLDMLRLHSKTILKMNASVVVFILMLLIALFSNLNSFVDFKDETCKTVSLEVLVCKVRYTFRVLYSVSAVLWNSLVAFVLVSTCRTHVIGIRRFMQALEQDARVYESRYLGLVQQVNTTRPVLEEYTWVDEDYLDDLRDTSGGELENNSSILIPQQRAEGTNTEEGDDASLSGPPQAGHLTRMPFSSSSSSGSVTSGLRSHSCQASAVLPPDPDQPRRMSVSSSGIHSCQPSVKPLMSNSEILFRYWKIQTRLRMSSVALQRWMMSVLCLVVMWLAMNLIAWLNYDPTLIDLANFFLPLILLPLISSAYAEVNQEGLRLLKFICPVEERLQLLYVLQNSPLQMTVYGFSLSYSTITTAAFGVLLAFASKVLIQEISGINSSR